MLIIRTNWADLDERFRCYMNKMSATKLSGGEACGGVEGMASALRAQINRMSTQTKSCADGEGTLGRTDKKICDKASDRKTQLTEDEIEQLQNKFLCVICLSKDKNALFLPCAHLAACLDCSLSLVNCPICRAKIQATVRAFN